MTAQPPIQIEAFTTRDVTACANVRSAAGPATCELRISSATEYGAAHGNRLLNVTIDCPLLERPNRLLDHRLSFDIQPEGLALFAGSLTLAVEAAQRDGILPAIVVVDPDGMHAVGESPTPPLAR